MILQIFFLPLSVVLCYQFYRSFSLLLCCWWRVLLSCNTRAIRLSIKKNSNRRKKSCRVVWMRGCSKSGSVRFQSLCFIVSSVSPRGWQFGPLLLVCSVGVAVSCDHRLQTLPLVRWCDTPTQQGCNVSVCWFTVNSVRRLSRLIGTRLHLWGFFFAVTNGNMLIGEMIKKAAVLHVTAYYTVKSYQSVIMQNVMLEVVLHYFIIRFFKRISKH